MNVCSFPGRLRVRPSARIAVVVAAWAFAFGLVETHPLVADEVALIENTTFKSGSVIGGRVRGPITKETASAVTVSVNDQAVVVPLDQVQRIRYDEETSNMVAASGRTDMAKAADEFQKAAAEVKGKTYLEQAALHGQYRSLAVLALADPARIDGSIKQLQDFLKRFPDSRHKVPTLEMVLRLQLQKNDLAGAQASADQLIQVPWAADRGKVLTARIAVKAADTTKLDSALTQLEGLSRSSKNPAVKRDALLAKAEVLAAQKKFDQAETTVKEAIAQADPDDSETQAAAHNTLGDCLLAANKPKDAILAYLRTDLLYDSDKEQHARSLAQIAKIWKSLKQDSRATEVIARLKSDYPSSPWTAAAQAVSP